MVRAKRRVLLHRAPKLRHHHHRRRRHPRTQVFPQRREPTRQFPRETFHLTLLRKMGVPPRQIDRCRLQPHVRLDESRELAQPVRKLIAPIDRPVVRPVFGRPHRLNPHQRRKRVARRRAELPALHRVEPRQLRAKRRRAPRDRKFLQALHHRHRRRPEQTLRQRLADRHACQRPARLRRPRLQIPPQPAARHHPAMLHQILRLEMRPRLILRPTRVHDRQLALTPRLLQRLQFRMEPEPIVQFHRRLRRHPQPRPRAIIMLVRHRRHEREPVRRTPQKNHHERPPLVAVA